MGRIFDYLQYLYYYYFKKNKRPNNLSKCKKCNVKMIIGDYCSSCVQKIQEEEILILKNEIYKTYQCLIQNDFNNYTIIYKSLKFLFSSLHTINRFFQTEWGKETDEEFRTNIFNDIILLQTLFLKHKKEITLLINEERNYRREIQLEFSEFSKKHIKGREVELKFDDFGGRFGDHIVTQSIEEKFLERSDRDNLHLLNNFNSLKYIFENKEENIYNLIDNIISNTFEKSKDEENITSENQNDTEKEENSKEEDMVEVYVSSIDNMSGYGECGVTLYLTKEEYKEIEEDISYYTDSPGGIIELIKKYSKEECVLVSRYQVFDKEDQIYYEIIETETVNSSKPYKELDKTYYKKGYVNHPDPVEYNEMDEKEIEEFNNEWDYMGDNRYYGNDVYTIEKFDLELELKTGY